jgi:hypothetical protein
MTILCDYAIGSHGFVFLLNYLTLRSSIWIYGISQNALNSSIVDHAAQMAGQGLLKFCLIDVHIVHQLTIFHLLTVDTKTWQFVRLRI